MRNYNLNYFVAKGYSFALIKNNKIFYKSQGRGLKPLVFCLRKYSAKGGVAADEKKEMRGAMIYDKIVGLAAAMLLASAKVKKIQTLIISQRAKKYLVKNRIEVIYEKEVKNIMNENKTDLCGMEKLAAEKGLRGLREFWKI
jgi:ribosomal protein L23